MPTPTLGPVLTSVALLAAISLSLCFWSGWRGLLGKGMCQQGRTVAGRRSCSEAHFLKACLCVPAGAVQHGESIDQSGAGSHWLF